MIQVKDGGACFGDSGGPNVITINGREVVASITRHLNGNFDCETGLWAYRLDTPAACLPRALHQPALTRSGQRGPSASRDDLGWPSEA